MEAGEQGRDGGPRSARMVEPAAGESNMLAKPVHGESSSLTFQQLPGESMGNSNTTGPGWHAIVASPKQAPA